MGKGRHSNSVFAKNGREGRKFSIFEQWPSKYEKKGITIIFLIVRYNGDEWMDERREEVEEAKVTLGGWSEGR